MRTILLCMAATALVLPSSGAQTRATEPLPPPRGTARLYITPAPGRIPGSLKELCNASSLIIEGTVERVLPSRETTPRSLETDAVVSVSRTLKGPSTVRQVVIAQRGGVMGEFISRPVQYSLAQPGERYLLFLREDKRPNTPEVPGLRRYLVTGIWSGLFHFQAGKMVVGADEPDSLRRKYEGMTIEQIVGAVMEALKS